MAPHLIASTAFRGGELRPHGAERWADAAAHGACQTSINKVSRTPKKGRAPSEKPRQIECRRHSLRLARMRRAVAIGAAEHQDALPDGFRFVPMLVTFTYAKVDAWEPNHIRECLNHLREFLAEHKAGPLRCQWVAELQERGAVHYHAIIWWPSRLFMPNPDDAGWWPHGSSNVKRARHAVAYLAKYASKGTPEGEQFPKGLRLHGCRGLPVSPRRRRAWLLRPKWLRVLTTPDMHLDRAPGGGWVDVETGEFFLSPWIIVSHAADWSSFTLAPRP